MKTKNLKLKLNQNKPKQYIQGWVEFYKLKFKVTSNVLIPRPETELLVDNVLAYIADTPTHRPTDPLTILDLGTGSGNIAISITKNLASHLLGRLAHVRGVNIKIIAADISSKALKVAKQNAKLHGVSDKITFIKSNLLLSLKNTILIRPLNNCIVVTNLPYIPTQRIPYLDTSVKDFEPKIALDGGEDGFVLYRKLFKQISTLRWKPKLIIGEIDYTHGELAVDEATKFFPEAQVEVKTDLTHKQRILIIEM